MSTIFDDDEIHTYVVIPPDGGWGHVVVLSSFICHFVIDGNIYTFGLFIQSLCEAFNVKVANISMVGAILNGVCYIVGPFVSACLNRYDFRFVSLCGCCIAATGYALSSFSFNYWMYLISQGILLGLGYGMLYVPALVMPSLYFAKWRAVAVAVATCGTGFGTFIVPKALTYVINTFGWRNTYLFMIGLVSVAAFSTLAFVPIKPKKVYSRYEQHNKKLPVTSMMNFKADKRTYCECCHWGNTYFPKTTDIVNPGDAVLKDEVFDKRNSIFGGNLSAPSVAFPFGERRRLMSTITYRAERCNYFWYQCLTMLCCGCLQTNSRPMYREDIFYQHSVMLLSENKNRAMKMRLRMAKEKHHKERQRARQETAKAMIEKQKQLDKQQASTSKAKQAALAEKEKELKKLEKEKLAALIAEEKKQNEEEDEEYLKEYHLKVTHVTTDHELYDTFRPCCGCHTSGLRTLATMLDFRLLKSMAFLILSFNGFLFTLGYGVPFMFIHLRAQENGIPEEQTVWYISMIGGANTIGRLIAGFLPCVLKVNCVAMICGCCAFQGIITACSGIYIMPWTQTLFAILYGILAGPYHALRSVIVVEIFGLENLTNIFGLQLVLSGIAAAIGPTVAGLLRDITHNYTLSFYFAGICIVSSSILLSVIKPVRNWEIRTNFVSF